MGHKLKLVLMATAVMGVTACGASTGGLQNALAQKVASDAIQSTIANDETTVVTTVTTETVAITPEVSDTMSPKCKKVALKMAELDARIAIANETISKGNGANMAGQAAAAAASQGAMHAGAAQVIGKVPFGGLFAKAAMDKVANSGKKKIAKAQKDIQKATLERAKLEGKFSGLNCDI